MLAVSDLQALGVCAYCFNRLCLCRDIVLARILHLASFSLLSHPADLAVLGCGTRLLYYGLAALAADSVTRRQRTALRARAWAPVAYISQGNGTWALGTDIWYTVLLSGISGIF